MKRLTEYSLINLIKTKGETCYSMTNKSNGCHECYLCVEETQFCEPFNNNLYRYELAINKLYKVNPELLMKILL